MKSAATTWKLTLSYDGTPFHGWQIQPDRPTVQGTLASAIARITGEQVLPQGSGRTDAGVHALGHVASFALAAPIPAANLLRALNRTLPASIRVLTAEAAAPGFHARHNALRKTYEYRIFESCTASARPGPIRPPFLPRDSPNQWDQDEGQDEGQVEAQVEAPLTAERICSPFLAPFVWNCRWPLAIEPMQRAAGMLCGTHDFTSFAATDPELAQRHAEGPTKRRTGPETGPQTRPQTGPRAGSQTAPHPADDPDAVSAPNPSKTIFTSTLTRHDDLLLYRVTGSGFLHHMVRNIVGTLAEIGRGSLDPDAIPRILAAHDRSAAGPTAPASGLFLVEVDYDEQPKGRT